ncbi:MYXO-CTERM sorting domain-containing protein [Sorangium sp. So ce1000]|uniref:MYXO-CTERM sorting domain-containing protein n=1 Tax=Sorangium sp. So ce1000 TaxID=3133325 RepID=UPI003F5DCE62
MRWSPPNKPSALAWRVALLAALGASGTARADVVQPNGTVIPVAGDRLSALLNGSANNDNHDEMIDVVADAAVEPQVFSPLCEFSGKYIAKGGGANFAVGWYNVDDSRASDDPPQYVPVNTGANLNTAAPESDVQILFPFSSDLPPAAMRELTAVSIRENPAYAGGLIGFVLIPNPNGTGNGDATQYHYTEHRFNVECTACKTPGPWYSDLIYRSNELLNTFYLGFEDLDFQNADGAAGINGNDLDYEDFLFRFSGITCPSAGQPCEVEENVGACRAGISDCDAQGQAICTPIVEPGSQAEQCDGIDNDCDDIVDEDAPCPENQVCSRGRCVDRCGSAEFPCEAGLVCVEGLCVEQACVDVMCDVGEVCHDGECRAPCDGVVCPHGQVCRGDRCLDPCDGVTCGTGEVCESGVCVVECGCRGCPSKDRCATDSGRCVEAACADVTCGAGTYCRGGACVDLCDGVVCPAGERCETGKCVEEPPAPATTAAAGPTLDVAASSGSGDAASGSGGAPSTGAGASGSGESSGCSCSLAGDTPSAGGVAALLLAVGLGLRRRSGGGPGRSAPSRRIRRSG